MKFIEKAKNYFAEKKTQLEIRICTITTAIIGSTALCYADGEITAKLNTLYSLMVDITRGLGMIVILFGVMQFGLSLRSGDGPQRNHAMLEIGGGLIVFIAGSVVSTLIA